MALKIRLSPHEINDVAIEKKATEATAINGRWVNGPGAALFKAIGRDLGPLPIIAEDLGVITPDVVALRKRFHLPGMRILQFAFGSGSDNSFLPHNYEVDTVVYTGTHDNDTVNGWYGTLNDRDRNYLAVTLGKGIGDPAWDLIRFAWSSVSARAR